ncbi:hypothetical protein TNCV_4770271 [Trichonephila clavipes]|nr:hypothetical protein TNCV_4770271 [Trichonephila clavipes]
MGGLLNNANPLLISLLHEGCHSTDYGHEKSMHFRQWTEKEELQPSKKLKNVVDIWSVIQLDKVLHILKELAGVRGEVALIQEQMAQKKCAHQQQGSQDASVENFARR